MTAEAPNALRCEYDTDPIGIGARNPRFFWRLRDTREGAIQTAYRLLVASDPARLARDEGDLWDSGTVSSDACAHVTYQGAALASRAQAWWKVQSFDRDRTPSPFSEPATFELGLLERDDWHAEWIASPLRGAPLLSPIVPAMRREFELPTPVSHARFYVTALGLYEIEINGERVGDHQLAPGWTDYTKRVRYQAYDVTHHLRSGTNSIEALLGDGWYCGWVGLRKAREAYGTRPALLCQLEVRQEDGTTTRIVSDGTWAWSPSQILSSDIMQGEMVDARRGMAPEEAWAPVDVLEDPGVAIEAMTGPPVRAMMELQPVGEPKFHAYPGFGARVLYDLGQNMVGRVRIRVRARAGTTIVVRHAEVLDEHGALYTANLRDARATDTYTLAGGGDGEEQSEVFEPRFTFHGFRYVEISGHLREDQIEEVTGVVLYSDLPSTGEFACSDPDVDKLYSNIVWGQRGNFVDVPTDCPQRDERLGWTGDAQVFVKTASLNMDVAGFFSKWLVDLEDSQGPDGEVPMFAPIPSTRRRPVDAGPAWADAIVICPFTLHRFYGDTALLARHFDGMAAYLNFLDRRFPSGVRSDPEIDPWGGFGDWVALDGTVRHESPLGGTPKDLIGTAFLAYSARLLSQIADHLDRDEERKRFAELSMKARAAFRRRFVTPDGLVAGNTQTSFVLALHFDLLEEAERAVTGKALARNVEQHGHLTTGFVGTPYLLHALTSIERLDLAYQLLLRRDFPSWLHPIVKGGATTIWERWNGWTEVDGFFDPTMNSFNHYAYGSVAEWLYGTVAGLDIDASPESAGWRSARFAPRPPIHPRLPEQPLLTRAHATVDTVRGTWRAAWQIEGERFHFEATVPPSGHAHVELPDGTTTEVTAGTHTFALPLANLRAVAAEKP